MEKQPPEEFSAAGKEVTCRGCKKKYICNPNDDYYNATTTENGVCEPCLLVEAGISGPIINMIPSLIPRNELN